MKTLENLFGLVCLIGSFILAWEVFKDPGINTWLRGFIIVALIHWGFSMLPRSKEDKMNSVINQVGVEDLLIHIKETLQKKKTPEKLHEEAVKVLEETKL